MSPSQRPVTSISQGIYGNGVSLVYDFKITNWNLVQLFYFKYPQNEMLCWRRMEKISWTDHVRNEEVLLRVNEQRNILHEIVNGRRTGLVTFFVETAFYNGLLKERYKGG